MTPANLDFNILLILQLSDSQQGTTDRVDAYSERFYPLRSTFLLIPSSSTFFSSVTSLVQRSQVAETSRR